MRRILSRAALGLVAANLLFTFALVASQCVGRERVAAEVRAAAEAGQLPAADHPPLPLPALNADRRFLDGFTECSSLALLVLGDPHAPFTSALRSSTLAAPATGSLCAALESLVAKPPAATAPATLDYFVYWHGTQVLARPIVALAGPLALRVVVAMLLALAFAWLIVELARTSGGAAAAIVAACLLLLADLANAALVTVHAMALAIVLATAASVARSLRRPRDATARVVWSAAAGGAAFAFVDLLVNPPLGPTLLAAIVLLHRLADRTPTPVRAVHALGTATATALVWFGAWAATWCARWALAALAIGFDPVVEQVRARATFRIAGAWSGVRQEAFAATAANLDAIGIAPVAVVVAMAAAAFGVAMLRPEDRGARAAGFAAFVAIAALPLLWFETLRNHSQIHAWFTFRSLAASAAALLLGALWALRARSDDAPVAKRAAMPLRHS